VVQEKNIHKHMVLDQEEGNLQVTSQWVGIKNKGLEVVWALLVEMTG
jgi:hypothetical protein